MATLMVSTAIAGYVSSPTRIMVGMRLTTPSTSGAMLITPTPSALMPNSSIGPNMPGHSNNHGIGSPILATPRGTAFLLVCVVPTCAMITPLPAMFCMNSMSLPCESGSENSMGITIIPAPFSRNFHTMSARISLGHGHCPNCSTADSSSSTITTSLDCTVTSVL